MKNVRSYTIGQSKIAIHEVQCSSTAAFSSVNSTYHHCYSMILSPRLGIFLRRMKLCLLCIVHLPLEVSELHFQRLSNLRQINSVKRSLRRKETARISNLPA